MAKPEPAFTMADLLAELKEQMPDFHQGSAMTTVEMAEALGVSETTMRRRLKKMKAAGLVSLVKKQIVALNDVVVTVTAWTIPRGGEITNGSIDLSNRGSCTDALDRGAHRGSQEG